jgi:hypothetical protein
MHFVTNISEFGSVEVYCYRDIEKSIGIDPNPSDVIWMYRTSHVGKFELHCSTSNPANLSPALNFANP